MRATRLRARQSWILAAVVCASAIAGSIGCQEASRPPTSATTPASPPAFDLTGDWVGEYEETGCQSTVCPVCCTSRGKGPPRVRALTLTLTQTQGTVTGVWRETPQGGTLSGTFLGDVRGPVLSLRGSLFLMDASGSAFPDVLPRLLTDFSAQLSSPNAVDTGTFVLVERDVSGQESMRLSNRLVNVRRRQ